MEGTVNGGETDEDETADILGNLATLMRALHTSDLALQNAISSLACEGSEVTEFASLQHVDLVTQTHCDLANLLERLAERLRGVTVTHDDLRESLSLRSLQDSLLVPGPQPTNDARAGEVSLF